MSENGQQVLTRTAATARSQGRDALLESEGLAVLAALGIRVPAHRFLARDQEVVAADLTALGGDRVVVKVAAPRIAHKSAVGGVRVVPRTRAAVAAAVAEMRDRCGAEAVGYLLCEHVDYDRGLGGELLVGMRWSEDFGPVVTFGPGGIWAEHLARNFKVGHDLAVLSPALTPRGEIAPLVAAKAITPLATGGGRGQPARIELRQLVELLATLLELAAAAMPEPIRELEINPLALAPQGPVALDVLVRLSRQRCEAKEAPPRPVAKLRHLLRPESLAILGVSERAKPGRIILQNTLRAGFDPARIFVVKPGREEIAGCRCYPDLASLPGRMDLVILSLAAPRVPAAVAEIVARRQAESLIVIPGGLGERTGSEGLAAEIEATLGVARSEDWQGPVVNGGNCLGIRSLPGRYDTLFVPGYKLPAPEGEATPLALISQSGAFAVARASRLGGLNPRYLISIGNQLDLTVGDYLSFLGDDPEVEIIACYVEGFRPGDGRRFLAAARAATAAGKTVVLYRAGRTPAGVEATASHTAAIAGDYAVTRELATAAGVVVAESLADFDDLVRLFCLLRRRRVGGLRLGGLSNAGFECVAMADAVGGFDLPPLSPATVDSLAGLLARYRLDGVVAPRNPVDVTPIMDGEGFEAAARAVLDDPAVDVGVIGCVPLTGALVTLAAGPGHGEDLDAEDSIVRRLIRLRDAVAKAWVAVVDAGALYDPLAAGLEAAGVPAFRSADRALRLFERFCRHRLRADGESVCPRRNL